MQTLLRRCLGFLLLYAVGALGQSNSGELHVRVIDPSGAPLKSEIRLVSEANGIRKDLATDDQGSLVLRNLPYGLYGLEAQHPGFASATRSLDLQSSLPTLCQLTLDILAPSTSVLVTDAETLVDPHRIGTVVRIGQEKIENRQASLPGRALQDLVNSQPGWLYEGNAVLHPRGSEYQTQIVVDGIPLTENRSPSFGPELPLEGIQSVSIYTAGIPAEYGRKLGGIIELNTIRELREGVHGQLEMDGGSFGSAGFSLDMQRGWKRNTLGAAVDASRTDWYLNPPVIQNYTNRGTTGSFALNFERELGDRDRLRLRINHSLSRFLVPNELIQEFAGQRQDRNNLETMGSFAYQHVFSTAALAQFHTMVRDNSNVLNSNPLSTPMLAFQNNGFREGYVRGAITFRNGVQEWKIGAESDSLVLLERFRYQITDPSQLDEGTPGSFAFTGNRSDLEQSAFVQDLIAWGRWTISAGLRWDHYQLLLNQNAVSPRIGVSRYFPSSNFVVHASYDRVFQTPDFRNILLSSSAKTALLGDKVLQLPVEPSSGNYFDLGFTKALKNLVKLEVDLYERRLRHFADDDQLLDTGVSFPIAFRRARIYGAEGKVEIPFGHRISGATSYSYMVGSAYFPVTGGLFLAEDASQALAELHGRFWVSQDQRHTLRESLRVQLCSRFSLSFHAQYGSGLPVEFSGTQSDAIAQYGAAIVDRVDLEKGRVRPSLSLDTSVGIDLRKGDRWKSKLYMDAANLNNRLNLINFDGLFSGNAIAPPRSYSIRWTNSF